MKGLYFISSVACYSPGQRSKVSIFVHNGSFEETENNEIHSDF